MAHSLAAQQGKTQEFWVGFNHHEVGSPQGQLEALQALLSCAYGAELSSELGATLAAELTLNAEPASSAGLSYVLVETDTPLSVSGRAALRAALLLGQLPCDVWYDPFPNFYHGAAATAGSAVVMDMDMTSVQIEGIDEIARRLGVYEQVAAITEQAMQGHLDFAQSLTRRVALLKGGNAAQVLASVKANMPWTPGLSALIEVMNHARAANPKTQFCVASGGFHNLIAALDEHAHYNQIAANRLAVDESGHFTGAVDGPIIDGQAKAHLVQRLKTEQGLAQDQIIVVGDGANDLIMMAEGGCAVAYHAKPKVQAQVHNLINHCDLTMLADRIKLDQGAQPQSLLTAGRRCAVHAVRAA